MIKIVVDSTADIPAALREQYDITVVPILAQFGNETFRDGVDITRDEFYTRLIASPEPPKTAAPAASHSAICSRTKTRNRHPKNVRKSVDIVANFDFSESNRHFDDA